MILLHRDRHPRSQLEVHLGWEPRDLWFGAYVEKPWTEMTYRCRSVYLIALPTVYLRVVWRTRLLQPGERPDWYQDFAVWVFAVAQYEKPWAYVWPLLLVLWALLGWALTPKDA